MCTRLCAECFERAFFFPKKLAEKGLSVFSLSAHAASARLPVLQLFKGSGFFPQLHIS